MVLVEIHCSYGAHNPSILFIRYNSQIYLVADGKTDMASSRVTTNVWQVITGSHDCQIKLWDLVAGKAMTTLTHHKKAVRALKMHPKEFSFVSAAADNMKKWQVSWECLDC